LVWSGSKGLSGPGNTGWRPPGNPAMPAIFMRLRPNL
jgi:hypothetical protein